MTELEGRRKSWQRDEPGQEGGEGRGSRKGLGPVSTLVQTTVLNAREGPAETSKGLVWALGQWMLTLPPIPPEPRLRASPDCVLSHDTLV